MALSSIETDAAVYFYGMREKRFGFLSNFYACRFVDANGTTYISSEQYFMKRKQELFDLDNHKLAVAILRARTPTDAKRLGRQVKNYDDDLWAACRLSVMVDALKLKFSSDHELSQKLLATGEKRLYEASHRDAIWGIGLSVGKVQEMFRENQGFFEAGDVPEAMREQCYGQNLLGHALMMARTWLREQEQLGE